MYTQPLLQKLANTNNRMKITKKIAQKYLYNGCQNSEQEQVDYTCNFDIEMKIYVYLIQNLVSVPLKS